jgi:glycosyltransferase involved in cell wall biosynthesis
MWRIFAVGLAAAWAVPLQLANRVQLLPLDDSVPARTKNHRARNAKGRQSERRRRRTARDYYVFLEFKMTRRVPVLFRYHYSVWAFRLKTYPRRVWSRGLPAFPFKMPKMSLQRLLGHNDRLGCLNQYRPKPVKYDQLPVMKCLQDRLPAIAIATPSYNQARYLEQTIRSVLDNGYSSLQYAVVDGGSQDESPLILERYSESLTYWFSEPDRGQSHAIQKGFQRVQGDIMAYLNSDDMLLPGALRLVATYFANHPEVDMVYGHRILIDQSGLEVGRWILPPHSNEATRRADYIPQETLFWRSYLYWRIGGVDTSFRFAIDWDLILRFQATGGIFHRLPYFLACFRVHDSQKTSSIKESVGEAEVELLRERELGKNRNSWDVQKHDRRLKNRAFITELAAKCGCRSTRF